MKLYRNVCTTEGELAGYAYFPSRKAAIAHAKEWKEEGLHGTFCDPVAQECHIPTTKHGLLNWLNDDAGGLVEPPAPGKGGTPHE